MRCPAEDSEALSSGAANGSQSSTKQKWESAFATKALAQARLNEVLSELGEGDYIEPKSTTFEGFAEQWLGSRVSIRGSTLSAYRSLGRQWLIPFFGKQKVSDIQLSDVQNLVTDLSGKVASKTLKNCLTLLRDAGWQERRECSQVRFHP